MIGIRFQKRVRREFFPDDYKRAVALLSRWYTLDCAPGETPGRMHGAGLALALSDYAELKRAIRLANLDFCDVLAPGFTPYVANEPGEAVASGEEEAFLKGIRRKPPDSLPRLVYADWLDDRGDGHRAEYLRVLCRWMAAHPTVDRALVVRERELRVGLGRGWLARVRGMRVRAT